MRYPKYLYLLKECTSSQSLKEIKNWIDKTQKMYYHNFDKIGFSKWDNFEIWIVQYCPEEYDRKRYRLEENIICKFKWGV